MGPQPIEQAEWQAEDLIRDHPPRWKDRNKRVVFDIACSSGHPFEGRIRFARWAEEQPPPAVTPRSVFAIRPGVFDYAPPAEPTAVAWHVNFADPRLFVAYSSALLAQDELQVAEHPILGSVAEARAASGCPARTVDERGRPTPVTITGVQRRCVIDTLPRPEAGRARGLYGNAFSRAPKEQVTAATRPLAPPTITHILAMAAVPCGHDAYDKDEISYMLNAAHTGFSAARRESEHVVAGSRTVIHTGFWGCGAFGGNRTLMTILQALAGDLADVDIVYWAFDQAGLQVAGEAYEQYVQLRNAAPSVSSLVDELIRREYRWGVSDGN